MKTVWGLTGIGLATFVVFACSVDQASGMSADDPAPASAEPERKGIRAHLEEAPLIRARRRVQARQHAEIYGLDAKELEADAAFFGRLYTRAGPTGYLLALKKKKEAAVARD